VNKRILVPLALLVLAAFTLAACGGGGSSAEDEITEVIETAANSGETGKAAVKACEAEAKEEEEQAEAASVSNVSVNGEKATAEVEFEGGPLDSQTLEVALVEEGGSWKLDQIEGFAEYDGKALEEAFLKRFEEEPEGVSQAQYTCIAEGIGKASKAEAKELFLSGSPEKLEELARGCA
jgi:hypothetical protein